MAKVFISYRRTDSAPYTGRIYDRLVAKFGRKNVFKDVDDIPAGVNFATYIQDALRECAVELVVIGREWLESRTTSGGRRLDDPADFVRVEIETALGLGLMVIPILLDGAAMPPPSQLPEPLRQLALINGLVVRNDPDFSRDMERVIAALERAFAARPASGVFARRARSATPAVADASVPAPARTRPPAAVRQRPATTPKPPVRSRPPSAALARAWRPLVAGLAALLVVTSFGVLFSKGVLPTLAGSPSATQTTTRSIPSPTATLAVTYPYTAQAPGPGSGCTPGAAQWHLLPNDSNASCTANPGHLRLHPGGSDTFASVYMLALGSGIGHGNLPSTYTVSVQISGLSANTVADLGIASSSTDYFNSGTDSYGYHVEATGDYSGAGSSSGCFQFRSGHADPASPVTFAIAVGATNVSAKVNGASTGSCSDTTMTANPFVQVTLSVSNGSAPQADFTNFSIV